MKACGATVLGRRDLSGQETSVGPDSCYPLLCWQTLASCPVGSALPFWPRLVNIWLRISCEIKRRQPLGTLPTYSSLRFRGADVPTRICFCMSVENLRCWCWAREDGFAMRLQLWSSSVAAGGGAACSGRVAAPSCCQYPERDGLGVSGVALLWASVLRNSSLSSWSREPSSTYLN